MVSVSKINFVNIFLLLTLFAILVTGSKYNSATTDEMAHVTAGYAFLAAGKESLWFSSYHMTPPLLNILEAALIYLEVPDLDLQYMDGWGVWWRPVVASFADHVFGILRTPVGWYLSTPSSNETGSNVVHMDKKQSLLAARIPTIYLTLLLGALVCRWGRDLFGRNVALLSLLILTLDPTLLAHGRLATTDVGLVTFGTAALYMTWRWYQKPDWWLTLGIGLVAGATLASKSSGVLWLIACTIMILIKIIISPRNTRRFFLFLQLCVLYIISLLVIWALYHFTWGPVATFDLLLPAPAYWETFIIQAQRSADWVFALNLRKLGRWTWYLLLAFSIKNPLPFLVAIAVGIKRYSRIINLNTFLVFVFPILYTAVSFKAGANIGYRYMLAIHPFLYLLAGKGLYDLSRKKSCLHYGFVAILILWQIIELITIYPNEIGYFNQLTHSSTGGYKYLADSNTEWGQSTGIYFTYVQQHPEVMTHPITKFFPKPGKYLINPAQLQGTNIGDPYTYEWFRHQEPVAILTNTLLLYEVPDTAPQWIAQCNVPVIALEQEVIANTISNGHTLRSLDFNCAESWVYPTGGRSSGFYTLHGSLLRPPRFDFVSFLYRSPVAQDPFINMKLASAHFSYWQDIATENFPIFALYHISTSLEDVMPYIQVRATAAATSMNEVALQPLHTTPILFDSKIAFVGAQASFENDRLEVETWWEMKSAPIDRPFSIMAHLLSISDPDTVGIADGLGIAPSILRNGDIFIQKHVFTDVTATQVEQAWLRIGVYWSDTLDRWGIITTDTSDAVFLPVSDLN